MFIAVSLSFSSSVKVHQRDSALVRSMIKHTKDKLHLIRTKLMIADYHLTKAMGVRDPMWVKESVRLRLEQALN